MEGFRSICDAIELKDRPGVHFNGLAMVASLLSEAISASALIYRSKLCQSNST
jgi:hypothetical protein